MRNHKLRSIPGSRADHTHNIIIPDTVDPIEAVLDPSSQKKAPVWAELGSLTGKRCSYGAEHQQRVNPIDTQDRIFGEGRNGGDQGGHGQRHRAEMSFQQRRERMGF